MKAARTLLSQHSFYLIFLISVSSILNSYSSLSSPSFLLSQNYYIFHSKSSEMSNILSVHSTALSLCCSVHGRFENNLTDMIDLTDTDD